MNYSGKKQLYKFLKDKGYNVPIMKLMEYTFYRGDEWLKYYDLKLYSPARGVIYVTVCEENKDGEQVEKEYSKYMNGVLNYQIKNGKKTVV